MINLQIIVNNIANIFNLIISTSFTLSKFYSNINYITNIYYIYYFIYITNNYYINNYLGKFITIVVFLIYCTKSIVPTKVAEQKQHYFFYH